MSTFVSELSGSLIFRSGSLAQASLVPKANALALTGSLNITGSSLTFNGSDIISRIVNLEAGTGGGESIGPLNIHSASINNFTSSYYTHSASFDSRIDAVESTTSTNSSAITQLQSNTSSYISSTSQLTDSGFLTSSNSSIVSSSGQIAALGYITSASVTVPAGTVSSSAQISALGYITGSPENTISSSQQILDLGFVSGSHTGIFTETGSFYATSRDLQVSGSFRVSGSVAANSFISTDGTGQPTLSSNSNLILSASDAVIIRNALLRPGRFSNANTGSLAAIDGDILFNSSSNKLQFYSGSAFYDIGASNIPAGTISSSQQIADLGYITSSTDTDLTALNTFTASYYVDSASFSSRIDTVTVDTSSLDTRITSLETFSSSLDTNFATDAELSALSASAHTARLNITASAVNTSSLVTTASFNSYTASYSASADTHLDALIAGLSSSAHTARLNITASSADTTGLLTTASYQVDSASFDSRISSINASGDTSYNGNKVISNILLGDLYSNSFNAGTTGSIQNFLDAIFFPTSAPTATFTNQTSIYNANQATSGSNLVSVSITDTVDESPYTLVLSGTGASSLNAVPQNAASSSWQIQAASDLAGGTYTYTATVGDNGGTTRAYEGRTIVIASVDDGTLSTNGTFYIIESATSGPIYLNSNGRTGTQARVTVSYSPNYGSQVATNFQSSNSIISVNSNGYLSLGSAISGSGNVSGDTVTTNISWEDQYGNADTSSISVNVATNNAPSITETNTSNINTNQATSGSNLVTITFSDTEGDAINYDSFTFTQTSGTGTIEAVRSGTSFLVRPTSDLAAGSYSFTTTVTDEHGFNTRSASHSFTIAQADDGTLTGDTNIYIIESALSGSVFRDATGYNNGNPADVNVGYSPNYGSQVATFTSSNAAIAINSAGNLTLAVDLSGSLTQSGDTFNTTITWNDQYGNSDSATVTATVFGNQSPSATFTNAGFNTDQAVSGSAAGTISITDTESNTPFTLTLSGTSGSLFNPVPQNANSSSWEVQPTGSLEAGSYPITATIRDSYDEQATLNGTITVSQAATDTVYVYDVGFFDSTYNNNIGIQSVGSGTPASITSYTGFGFVEKIEDGYLGSGSFTFSWGSTRTATLLASASGAQVNAVLTELGTISKTNSNRFVIFMPSGSDMTGVPRTMTDGYGGSDEDEYVLEVATDGSAVGSGLGTTESSNIHKVTLGAAVNGVSDYIMVGPQNQVSSATSIELRIIAESGSAA